jgi:hypothetical protein
MRNSCDLLTECIKQHGDQGDGDENQTAVFLSAYLEMGCARRAAEYAGLAVSTHYKRMVDNPGYADVVRDLKRRHKNAKRRLPRNR